MAAEEEADFLADEGLEAKSVKPTLRQSMSLIDRFYNGGNRAKPEALDILVVVLDSVVTRMREQYNKRKVRVQQRKNDIKQIDEHIKALRTLQNRIAKDIEEKKRTEEELQHHIDGGTEVVKDAISIAREALQKVKTATKTAQARDCIRAMRSERGYDANGRPLPGREVNLRRKPGGPSARKPGDMLKDLNIKTQ